MAFNSQSSEEISDINIVPLVDIILVVLIIFMVTAPAFIKPSVPVQLPEATSGESTQPSLLNIAVTLEGEVYANSKPMSELELKEIAKTEFEKNNEVQALISADQGVSYGKVIEVLDWVKTSGVKNFAVTTDGVQGGEL